MQTRQRTAFPFRSIPERAKGTRPKMKWHYQTSKGEGDQVVFPGLTKSQHFGRTAGDHAHK